MTDDPNPQRKTPAKSRRAAASTAAKSGVPAKAGTAAKAGKPKPRRARRQTPEQVARTWARRLERTRPGLVDYVLDGLAAQYGRPEWQLRLDPVSELVLTILTQNTADVNAERAFESLRARFPSPESVPIAQHRRGVVGSDVAATAVAGNGAMTRPPDGWGGVGLPPGRPPDWAAIEATPVEELIEVIRHGGLAYQKAPRIQAALRQIREERGDYDLGFLAGLAPREGREWLTRIPGIGKKTASIVLLFCFGMPLFPIDTHVERVSKRIGLLPAKAPLELAHEMFLEAFAGPDMYAAHVLLITHGRAICHARNPQHDICPIADRCRFINPKAL
jgi:endonuclease III